MQHAHAVHVVQCAEGFVQKALDQCFVYASRIDLQHCQKVHPVHKIHCYVGGVVFLEDLVDFHDVRVIELCHAQRFAQETADDFLELFLKISLVRPHSTVHAPAHGAGKALFDDNDTIKTVAREIGHPATTADQMSLDLVLPVKQCVARQ